MAAPEISFFVAPTKDDECCTNWINNFVAVITGDTVMKRIQKDKLKTKHFELHYPQENMICHK